MFVYPLTSVRQPASLGTGEIRLAARSRMMVAAVLIGASRMSAQFFTDTFESYSNNAWPTSNWTAQFNAASAPSTNLVVTDPAGGDHALKLTNANNWSAFAFRQVTLPSTFRFEADVYEPSSNGGIGYQVIDLWSGLGTGSLQRMVSFRNETIYVLGDPTGTYASAISGNFTFDTWHHVTIDYVRGATTTVSFSVDGTYLGQWSTTGYGGAWDTSFTYLGLGQAQINAYSGYFDNVSVSSIPEPSTGAGIFGLIALGFAVYRKQKKPV